MVSSIGLVPLRTGLINNSGKYKDYQDLVLFSFDQIKNVATLPGPKFVFIHIPIPHPAFIFDQNGPVTPDRPYLVNDGKSFAGTQEEYHRRVYWTINFLEFAC